MNISTNAGETTFTILMKKNSEFSVIDPLHLETGDFLAP